MGNKNCDNYGSSWCIDFGEDCESCPAQAIEPEAPQSEPAKTIREKINAILAPSGFSIGSIYLNDPDEPEAEYIVCDSDGDEIDIDSLTNIMKHYMTPDTKPESVLLLTDEEIIILLDKFRKEPLLLVQAAVKGEYHKAEPIIRAKYEARIKELEARLKGQVADLNKRIPNIREEARRQAFKEVTGLANNQRFYPILNQRRVNKMTELRDQLACKLCHWSDECDCKPQRDASGCQEPYAKADSILSDIRAKVQEIKNPNKIGSGSIAELCCHNSFEQAIEAVLELLK